MNYEKIYIEEALDYAIEMLRDNLKDKELFENILKEIERIKNQIYKDYEI